MNVSISKGNSKMGDISSVSLPTGKTCGDAPCARECYAKKLERLRPNVREAYENNYRILINDPNTYWREVEATIMMSRFFRFHVSGDIPNAEYLSKMIDVVGRNPHCEVLCFTKRFRMVNKKIESFKDEGRQLPKNLHLIFSGWKDLVMDNPYGLPEAHVRYHDGSTTARTDAKECGGNCTECAQTNGGCWSLNYHEQVVFNKH